MHSRKFSAVVQTTPASLRDRVRFNLDVQDRIRELLLQHYEGQPELLADAMGQPVAEVTRLCSGYQEYNIPALLALGRAFDEPVIGVTTSAQQKG